MSQNKQEENTPTLTYGKPVEPDTSLHIAKTKLDNGGTLFEGNFLHNSIHSNIEGNDILRGNQGNDAVNAINLNFEDTHQLYGGDGEDILRSDAGSTIMDGGTGDDIMLGATRQDIYFATHGNTGTTDMMLDNEGNDHYDGRLGTDTISYAWLTNEKQADPIATPLVVNLQENRATMTIKTIIAPNVWTKHSGRFIAPSTETLEAKKQTESSINLLQQHIANFTKQKQKHEQTLFDLQKTRAAEEAARRSLEQEQRELATQERTLWSQVFGVSGFNFKVFYQAIAIMRHKYDIFSKIRKHSFSIQALNDKINTTQSLVSFFETERAVNAGYLQYEQNKLITLTQEAEGMYEPFVKNVHQNPGQNFYTVMDEEGRTHYYQRISTRERIFGIPSEIGTSNVDWAYFGTKKPTLADLPEAQRTNTQTDVILNIENIIGSEGNDMLTGNEVANEIHGGAGDDTLNGGAGDDTLNGGAGDDTLNGGAGDDTLNGGAGDDTLISSEGTDTYDGGEGTDTLSYLPSAVGVHVNLSESTHIQGIENITGSNHDDTLIGDAANNIFNGGAGGDSITGGAGDDTINGGTGGDVIIGGTGNDALNGDEGSDLLTGHAGDDTINGGAGDDTLEGGLGADQYIIDDNAAHDTIYGDTQDTVIYKSSTLSSGGVIFQRVGDDLSVRHENDASSVQTIARWFQTADRQVAKFEFQNGQDVVTASQVNKIIELMSANSEGDDDDDASLPAVNPSSRRVSLV